MTLVIEGDLAQAQTTDKGRQVIAKVRLGLITGGRNMLAGAGGTKNYVVDDEHGVFTLRICLHPEIARRLYTSGAELTEEEIAAGMEQLRVSDEDVARVTRDETITAIAQGIDYALAQFQLALYNGDERALHKAWEMARRVNGLRKRLTAMNEGRGE